MKPDINPNKVVVFTGAGISAESGLSTFRDSGGLWDEYPIEVVASISGWLSDPELVLDFYNRRRAEMVKAEPNSAHHAIAALEKDFDVVVVTQNVDNLHERAGSSKVLHLHGELSKARSTIEPELVYDIGGDPITLGQKCEFNSQLRPHIVWFGEYPFFLEESKVHLQEAAHVLVVGTSLNVEPAASLLKKARHSAEKLIVTLDIDHVPFGYKLLRGKATALVPSICEELSKRSS